MSLRGAKRQSNPSILSGGDRRVANDAPRDDKNNIVVTGVGLVTPLALDREESWRRLSAGESAVSPSGARVDLREGSEPRAVAFALRAAEEAARDAGLNPGDESWGCSVSCSKPI